MVKQGIEPLWFLQGKNTLYVVNQAQIVASEPKIKHGETHDQPLIGQ